LKILRF
ncbi:NADP-specific glutamate dehydrogenase, partial [Haemophilus influenzae]